MSVDSEQDPLCQCYNALWALAESSPRLKNLVRLRNRIKWNDPSWTPPDKPEVGDADLPELGLVWTQGLGKIRANSSSSSLTATFEWWLATGDPNVTRGILPLGFALYCAMTPWVTVVQTSPPTWRGKPFIKRVDLNTANSVLNDPERNRGVRGWSCVWACEVETWLTTSDVTAAALMTLPNTN